MKSLKNLLKIIVEEEGAEKVQHSKNKEAVYYELQEKTLIPYTNGELTTRTLN